jgi:DNA-damage-inducible protein J
MKGVDFAMSTPTTARLSVNIDSDVKKKAQAILSEIGMDLTTAIDLLLRTIVREERIPFELRTMSSYREELHRQYIQSELEKAKAEAADPNTRMLCHSELSEKLRQQRAARHGL